MPKPFDARYLDIARFASERGALTDTAPLADFSRLSQEVVAETLAADTPAAINWQARGEMRRDPGLDDDIARPALHLRARTCLPLVCQRCLRPVWMEVAVDRHFLFALNEAQAARLDGSAENDVLALAEDFDVFGLIEDELLLALPFAPRHDRCPPVLPGQNTGLDAEATNRPHPFAALAVFKAQKRRLNNL